MFHQTEPAKGEQMSKGIILTALAIFSFSALSGEIQIGNGTDKLTLNASEQIFREVVEYEPYDSTCYREVDDGYGRECRTVEENHCTKVPYECHSEPIEICEDVRQTRTESYSCVEYRRVSHYEYDHTEYATVEAVKNGAAKDIDLNSCMLGIKMDESTESFFAKCETAIVKLKVLDRKKTNNNRTIKVALDFSDISNLEALKSGLSELTYKKGVLTFSAANLETAKNFKLHMKLIRDRIILKDKVLIDQDLKSGMFKTIKEDKGAYTIAVDVSKLTEFDSTLKHMLTLTLETLKPVDLTGAINTPALSNKIDSTLKINE
jgi:hypothetical protein